MSAFRGFGFKPAVSANTGLNELTGDGTAGPGTGSQALTLATVNGNVGSFTNANVTVNAKGLVTAASNGTPVTSGLLGSLLSADMNVDTNQAIAIAASKYVIRKIIVTNASISLTTAVGGIYDAVAKGGNVIVANTQVYSALTTAAKFVDLTLAAFPAGTALTSASVYLSLTTPQGAAATADVYIFGDVL